LERPCGCLMGRQGLCRLPVEKRLTDHVATDGALHMEQ
jgi:hypothetical protein